MRNGYRVFDADTHVRPSAKTVRSYLDPSVLDRIPDLEEHTIRFGVGNANLVHGPDRRWYRFDRRDDAEERPRDRYLGEAWPRVAEPPKFRRYRGARSATEGASDFDPQARLRDMDEEGVDVQFIVHSGGVGHPDPELEFEFVRADHRYLNDLCSADPHRLKSCITVTPLAEASVQEIKRWGGSPWAVAVYPKLPAGFPLDHPDLNPVWAAAEEAGLCVLHHSSPSEFPGDHDLWGNPFLFRLAEHPWGAMRAVASFIGAGHMDRFPSIRFVILESGVGWLPYWAGRMDDQSGYMGYVAENLQHKISEYLTMGRFFAGIIVQEGDKMVRLVTDDMGENILMFGSDYTHSESFFPESVDRVLAWDLLSHDEMRKVLWDNAARAYGQPT